MASENTSDTTCEKYCRYFQLPLPSEECKTEFTNDVRFGEHVKRVHGQKKLCLVKVCHRGECEKFHGLLLRRHEFCDINDQCKHRFIHLGSLNRHIKKYHPNHWNSLESLNSHIASHQASGSSNLMPKSKKQKVEQETEVKKKIKYERSSDEKQKCPICDSMFLISDLQKHINKCAHKCDLCNAVFKSKDGLIRHKAIVHEGKQPWNQDGQVHEEEKVFHCEVCNKYFTSNALLTRHNNEVHEEKPFDCKKCNRSYTSERSLKAHDNSVHARKEATTVVIRYLRP